MSRQEIRNQFPEYPPEILELQDRAARTAARLREDFGPLVVARPVGLDTLRGLWLSLRHRMRNDLFLVVNGRRVLPGTADYEAVRAAVAEERAAPARAG